MQWWIVTIFCPNYELSRNSRVNVRFAFVSFPCSYVNLLTSKLLKSYLSSTGSPPLTWFLGPGKNQIKGKPRYRRSILVLKPQNEEYVGSKSTFLRISKLYFDNFSRISDYCVPTNSLIVVKYKSIFGNMNIQ